MQSKEMFLGKFVPTKLLRSRGQSAQFDDRGNGPRTMLVTSDLKKRFHQVFIWCELDAPRGIGAVDLRDPRLQFRSQDQSPPQLSWRGIRTLNIEKTAQP